MATTPPNQITLSPATPATPLHGPSYDDESPRIRSSARLRQKRALESLHSEVKEPEGTRITKTPRSPRRPYLHTESGPRSPGQTPKRTSAPRVQVYSPPSPNSDSPAVGFSNSRKTGSQPYLSSVTMMAEGMLPTPVKTPKKRTIPKSSLTARALFQEPSTIEEMVSSPRKARKNKRYNGFSLESFRAEDEDGGQGRIQIFTDSRDQVPEPDDSGKNPFAQEEVPRTLGKRVPGTAKRRKISEARPIDPQVGEAIRKDEGMVYVFRGRKVYRRFDDNGEEEEEIDPEDIGLLEYTSPSTTRKRFQTLTRKSIKPTRLFQTEEQKRARELEKEEEAATDIEEAAKDLKSNFRSTIVHGATNGTGGGGSSKSTAQAKMTQQKGSPFDAWPRMKPGSSSTGSRSTARGRKRAISPDREEVGTII